MNDENDREQWFIAEEAKAWVNQGLYAPIGSFEKCLLEHRVGIPARKATVEEIIEHFKRGRNDTSKILYQIQRLR